MKFLFKYPTRSRPKLFKETFQNYLAYLSGEHEYEFVISIDNDDKSMDDIEEWLKQVSAKNTTITVCRSNNKSKVEAINADMIGRNFDILFLVSDDMIPIKRGFDKVVADDMMTHFPKLDGALHYHCNWWNNDKLIVLSIMGKKLYDYFGYIYHPAYLSESCDQEFTDVVYEIKKVKYAVTPIIQHRWIGSTHPDNLNSRNIQMGYRDLKTYRERKLIGFEK